MSQQGLTKIEGVPDRSTAIAGMAHFAVTSVKSRCAKYKSLTGKVGACIEPANAACKYWEARHA